MDFGFGNQFTYGVYVCYVAAYNTLVQWYQASAPMA
jgi:hypothetical protein